MGLVSVARTAADAACGADRFEACDVLVDDPQWSAADDAAWLSHLLLNPPEPLDTARLAVAEAVEALADLERRRSRLVGQQHRVMLALAGGAPRSRQVTVWDEDDTPRSVEMADEAAELIAAVLHRSPGSVRRHLALARALARLPRAAAALEGGELGADHAEQIARAAHDLPEGVLAEFERLVLDRVLTPGAALAPGEVGSLARRVRARLDAEGEESRRQSARRHEDVRIWAEEDGLACLQARLPLADAARVHAALDARARTMPYDPDHTMGMRRAAALVDALCGPAGDRPTGSGSGSGSAVALQVTVDLPTLMGLTDDPAFVDMASGAPEPITAAALRELLGDPRVPVTLRRLVTDPVSGQLLDRGRTCYRVPESLRAFLVARDGTCRFPGCSRHAERCDIDHVTAWSDDGATDRVNLLPLCRRHHLLKTHGEWSIVERRDDGAVVWRAPDGRLVLTLAWRSNLPPPPPSPPAPLAPRTTGGPRPCGDPPF